MKTSIKELEETIEWLNCELEKTKTSVNLQGKILTNIPEVFEKSLINLIERGLFIQAIKDYRTFTKEPLFGSKQAIDRLREYMASWEYQNERLTRKYE